MSCARVCVCVRVYVSASGESGYGRWEREEGCEGKERKGRGGRKRARTESRASGGNPANAKLITGEAKQDRTGQEERGSDARYLILLPPDFATSHRQVGIILGPSALSNSVNETDRSST